MKADLETAVLLYHDVTSNPNDSGLVRPAALPYKHTPEQFAQDLDQLELSPEKPSIVSSIDFSRSGRFLLLTFDDGGRSNIGIAEQLASRGWRGHFFIITERIGARTFLTRGEIREMYDMGHIIGSHSHTHPDIFYRQSFTDMYNEWRISTDIISQILGEPCMSASVPGGDISTQVFNSGSKAGLKFLFTSDPSLQPQKYRNMWVFGRVCIKANTPASHVGNLAQFQGWRAESIKWQGKKALKRFLFPLYNLYVKRKTRTSE